MNTNIALGIQRPRFNTGEDQRNALAIRGAQQQQVSNALAIQGQQEDRQIRREQMDFERQKYLASLGDADRKRIAGEIDTFIKVSPLLMNEQTYGQGYSLLQQAAPSAAAKLPETWTPEIVPAVEGMALGAKGLLDKSQFAQTFGETKRHNEAMERRPVAGNQITVNNAQETAEKREFGKTLVSEYAAVRDRADNAMGERQSLEQLRGIDVNSGRLEELKAGIASYAQALGIDPQAVGLPDPTNPQAFIGTAQQLVLRVMQAQKGPQTENDAKRIEMTVASLKNTPEAKDFLIDAAIAVKEREIEQADFYDAWRERKGTLDGARKGWRQFVERTPLMGNNPKTGRPVFFRQFMEAARQANPDASEDAILMQWRKRYGR